jgi:hypothetical protein
VPTPADSDLVEVTVSSGQGGTSGTGGITNQSLRVIKLISQRACRLDLTRADI